MTARHESFEYVRRQKKEPPSGIPLLGLLLLTTPLPGAIYKIIAVVATVIYVIKNAE